MEDDKEIFNEEALINSVNLEEALSLEEELNSLPENPSVDIPLDPIIEERNKDCKENIRKKIVYFNQICAFF